MHNHMMIISRNFYFHYFHNKKTCLIYLLDANNAMLGGFVVSMSLILADSEGTHEK